MKPPKLLVLDVEDVIRDLGSSVPLQSLFRHMPVQDLIAAMLCVPPYLDDRECMWELIGKRLESVEEEIDFHNLDFFIESTQETLDHIIRDRAGSEVDTGDFAFVKWIGQGSMILENSRSEYETATPTWFNQDQSRKLVDL